jgi:L-threonylcarbamoyladenylate synthase
MPVVTHARPTPILAADAAGIERAAALLRAGRLVAFPTETVYGLGAHALEPRAANGIFQAKGRPADDPLIVHVLDFARFDSIAVVNDRAVVLAEAFLPGPLTLVLPRLAVVPDVVTSGLDTVAVRVPAHAVARALLAAADVPIAAPSANLFGRPSPTRAEHVLEDLGGRIDAIVDGGPSAVGVESTIVDLSGAEPRLLRPGGVPAEAIESVLGVPMLPVVASERPSAPGLLPSHYAPRTPLVLVTGPPAAARERLVAEIRAGLAAGQLAGLLALYEDANVVPPGVVSEALGPWFAPARTAARLYDALRALDRRNLDVLFARELADPSTGLGRALADRLRRAATRVIEA